MTALVLRGDARRLPLPDESVDLIVTSPPYWALRSYTDSGQHYDGQIGDERDVATYLNELIDCTREMARVLKPSGSLWVVLGDKYASRRRGPSDSSSKLTNQAQHRPRGTPPRFDVPPRSLVGIPQRYMIRCIDELELVCRQDVIWSKPNGLPESVDNRCRRTHEVLLHFTKGGRYYHAVDLIRDDASDYSRAPAQRATPPGQRPRGMADSSNPLGALPPSVWTLPTQPLKVPASLGVDHYAAFPPNLVRRIVLGWSPAEICTQCDWGRWPVIQGSGTGVNGNDVPGRQRNGYALKNKHFYTHRAENPRLILGFACLCTPYEDRPASGSTWRPHDATRVAGASATGHQHNEVYDLVGWDPPPVQQAVVVDPFGGTGTTALVASALGRIGVSIDASHDYGRLARWRTTDPGERARAMQIEKPPPVLDGQVALL